MNDLQIYCHEADTISFYLIGKLPSQREKDLYAAAMQRLNIVLNEKETLLWGKMLKYKRLMAFYDAGLALTNPSSSIRRKIFVMLAILETSPGYTDYFLPLPFGKP